MNKEYAKLLQRKEWKDKRNEILIRDKHTCKKCGKRNDAMQVHHLYYDLNLKPWEYPDNAYITLCHSCHYSEHKRNNNIEDKFVMIFNDAISEICKTKSVIEIKVLIGILKLSSYNLKEPVANQFTNSITFKRKLVEIVGDIPFQSIDRAISLLCKRGLLIRHCKGEYSLNPKFFFKGSLSNRSQLELVYKVIPTDNTPFDEDSIINLSEGK